MRLIKKWGSQGVFGGISKIYEQAPPNNGEERDKLNRLYQIKFCGSARKHKENSV